MTVVRASAPGKVIVCGEYAVLDGAPAIVMAVDRRARVRVAAGGAPPHRVTFPGLNDRSCEFASLPGGRLEVRGGTGTRADLALVEQVWKAVAAAPGPALDLELDTRPFFHPRLGKKLGFGSSAALTVALAAALLRLQAVPGELAPRALSAHRAFQGGHGSGVDVAAALHGGLLAYRQHEPTAARPLAWPDGLRQAVLWSGRPARTAAHVARFRQAVRGRPARAAADRLGRAAEEVLAAWQRGAAPAIIDALKAYTADLRTLAVDHGLGIFDAGHDELHALARDRHLLYKPCGAGGGDAGIVLADREAAFGEFIDQAVRRGFERLDVTLDARGVETGQDQAGDPR